MIVTTTRARAAAIAAVISVILLGGGCAATTQERTGLVYGDLPAPVRASFESDHQTSSYDGRERHQALVNTVTERTAENGQRTYVVEYFDVKKDKHSVEYNAAGNEIESK